jgi:DNA-binding response OmpR family regulator
MAALKVLVVEDDPASLELMIEMLKPLKVEARPVRDGQEAADLIKKVEFDGIFLDLNMPTLSGFELARMIRESASNKNTPIIIVTGRDEKDTMYLSFSLGATYFLQKPIDSQQLTPLLQKIRQRSFENRRSRTRVPLNTDVVCTVGPKTLNGVTWNISQGGIQVEVVGLELGDSADLSFILPQAATVIRVKGFVVWAQEGRYGLYFTQVSLEDQASILAYVLRS